MTKMIDTFNISNTNAGFIFFVLFLYQCLHISKIPINMCCGFYTFFFANSLLDSFVRLYFPISIFSLIQFTKRWCFSFVNVIVFNTHIDRIFFHQFFYIPYLQSIFHEFESFHILLLLVYSTYSLFLLLLMDFCI